MESADGQWQRLEISVCEKTSFFKECAMHKHVKTRNNQIHEWNREVAKNKGMARTKRTARAPGTMAKTEMQQTHIFYTVQEKTREIMACQRQGCTYNRRRPAKKSSHKKNAAGVELFVDVSICGLKTEEMRALLDDPCMGAEMDWEAMKKEDNGELAPETLLTEVEQASVDQLDPSTQKVKKRAKKR